MVRRPKTRAGNRKATSPAPATPHHTLEIQKYRGNWEALPVSKKISLKVKELENILKVLEQVKEKEEKEMELWKEQTDEIKEFLVQIDKEIFSKL